MTVTPTAAPTVAAPSLGSAIRDNMYGVFALFIIIAGNYLGELFSCSVQRVLMYNQYVKHLMAFMTMYFFVIVIDPDNIKLSIGHQVIIMLVIYVTFILLTKCHACMTPVVVLMLFVLYCVKVHKQYTKEDELSAGWQAGEVAVEVLTAVLLVWGVRLYYVKQKAEFAEKFNSWTFIIGTQQQCNNTDLKSFIDKYSGSSTGSVQEASSTGSIQDPSRQLKAPPPS